MSIQNERHVSNVCGIRRKADGYWWECSAEHGAGWNPKRIRQAWTMREAQIEVRRMFERGAADAGEVEVVELGPRRVTG